MKSQKQFTLIISSLHKTKVQNNRNLSENTLFLGKYSLILWFWLQVGLMLVTALTPHIGYVNAGKIAHKAFQEEISLKKAAIDLGLVTAEQCDQWIVPSAMTKPTDR